MKKISIIGNCTKDAVVRTTNNRTAINFTVAVNESYKDSEGVKQERTDFFSCTIWRTAQQSTEVAKFIKKGTQVYVEGNPINTTYQTKENNTAIDQQIRVHDLKLLGSSSGTAATATTTDAGYGTATTAESASAAATNALADKLPF